MPVQKPPKKIVLKGCCNIRMVTMATKALALHVKAFGKENSSSEQTLTFNPGHLIRFKVTTTNTSYTIEAVEHHGYIEPADD